jgi:hypothetical protein
MTLEENKAHNERIKRLLLAKDTLLNAPRFMYAWPPLPPPMGHAGVCVWGGGAWRRDRSWLCVMAGLMWRCGACGHVGMWACGHVGMWACGHVGMWHVGMWACGHVGMWACGHVGLWAYDQHRSLPFGLPPPSPQPAASLFLLGRYNWTVGWVAKPKPYQWSEVRAVQWRAQRLPRWGCHRALPFPHASFPCTSPSSTHPCCAVAPQAPVNLGHVIDVINRVHAHEILVNGCFNGDRESARSDSPECGVRVRVLTS